MHILEDNSEILTQAFMQSLVRGFVLGISFQPLSFRGVLTGTVL